MLRSRVPRLDEQQPHPCTNATIYFRQILDHESRALACSHHDDDDVTVIFPRTSAHVGCVMERAELLLNVTIVGSSSGPVVGRSASNIDEATTKNGKDSKTCW